MLPPATESADQVAAFYRANAESIRIGAMFLVLPPLLWGVAAFNPGRAPDVTALMHEFANLMLVTTDHYLRVFSDWGL